MNKRKKLLLKINYALISLSLTQCHLQTDTDAVDIKEAKHLHQFHFVQKNEQLKDVAQKYKMSVEDLKRINQLPSDAYKLHRGQRLHIHKKDFDTYQMIPVVDEAAKDGRFTDYQVNKEREQESKEHYEQNKDKYDKLKKYCLLPIVGATTLGGLLWAGLKSLPKPGVNLQPSGGSNNRGDLPFASLGDELLNEPPPPDIPAIAPPSNSSAGGESVLKTSAAFLGTSSALGLGLMGLSKIVDESHKKRSDMEREMYYGQSCSRIAFGWPLNYQKRQFTYANPYHKEAGILIKNTQRELFIVPAFAGQIIDVQQPDEDEDRYTLFIKHKCNNLVTVYGNIRIPSEEKVKPANLIGIFVSKSDAIGLINPDESLFFSVKQIQAGRDAEKINYEFQRIAKHVARLIKYDKANGHKIDVGGLTFGVSSNDKLHHKTLLIGNKHVSEIFFKDPLIYLPKTPLS